MADGEDLELQAIQNVLRKRKFKEFLAAFATYTSMKSSIDLQDAKAARNARLQEAKLNLCPDDFTRFRFLFSHLHDHLMASLPLYNESQPLVQLYPRTTIRQCAQTHLHHISSQSKISFPGYVYGQFERVLRWQYLPSLEKLDWYTGKYIELPYQRQLRYIKSHCSNMLGLLYTACRLHRACHFRLHHLDSLMLLQHPDQEMSDIDYWSISPTIYQIVPYYSGQLKRLWFNFDRPWLEEDSPPFPLMPRLVFLQVNVYNEASYRLVAERLLWSGHNRIGGLHLRLAYSMIGWLFRILDQLPALVKLAVEYIRESGPDLGTLPNLLEDTWNLEEWKQLKILKQPGQQQVVKLKVLSLYIPLPDLFLNYLCQFFGATIVKIKITMAEDMIFNFEAFTALSILQLDFHYMSFFIPSFSGDHISSTRLTTLTLLNLDPVTCQILDIFGRTFPSLREINIGGSSDESYQHSRLTDDLLVASLQKYLAKVMIFRFTDHYIKSDGNLNHSIDLMLHRANQSGRRVIFQVPVDANVRRQMPAELKNQVLLSKWFRLI